MHRHVALPAALLLFGCAIAAAQTPQPNPVTPNNQSACPPGVGADAPTVGSGGSTSNLSDKLARSNGVICPPAGVDPDMQKPAPQGGRIKVIPPPGGPGGDQNTIPK